jgi:adenosylcobinamide kinase/adenosylcobinamide-phosphate guanylyltransferase
MTALPARRHELILGGARSGKSRTAEARAGHWLAASAHREATLIATALASDDEMDERIRRHRADRAKRCRALVTVEAPHDLPAAIRSHGAPQRLLVVDCLTLWLTQCLMPMHGAGLDADAWLDAQHDLLDVLRGSAGPVVLVSNEIGLGVLPPSREARACVDALGRLHQQVAELCPRVTLMVAGCELAVKDER